MAWRETCSVREKVGFCMAYEAGAVSMSELCRQFGVSRKTGYAVLARWRSEGPGGLAPRSHAPHCAPHAVTEDVGAAIIALRQRHPTWGPKKLKARLGLDHPGTRWPAVSTIGALLDREGLVARRKRKRHAALRTAPFAACVVANDVWSMDFKGWFTTGEGRRCEPLTLQDQASRYLLRLVAVQRSDTAHVWPVLDAAFREYGLPLALRSDNGPPFAGTGAGGLSALGVRLIKAGVKPDRIDPGKPQQNGRLERLHLTLKQETASPPAASHAAQARRFAAFRRLYNEQRPHEALGMATPDTVYAVSPRRWSGRLVSPDYDADQTVRRVRRNGEIKWRGEMVFVSSALAGEPVGLAECENGLWRVHYGPVTLGTIDSKGRLRRPSAVRALRRGEAPSAHGGQQERMANCVTHHPG